jgi:hypothetical protein
LNEWNFDFIKVDWCGGNWVGLDEQVRYTQIGELARRIKPSVVFNVCRWEFPGKWVSHELPTPAGQRPHSTLPTNLGNHHQQRPDRHQSKPLCIPSPAPF